MEDYTQGVSATQDATSPLGHVQWHRKPNLRPVHDRGEAFHVSSGVDHRTAGIARPQPHVHRQPVALPRTLILVHDHGSDDAKREPYPIRWATARRPWLARSEPLAHGVAIPFEPAHVQPDAFE